MGATEEMTAAMAEREYILFCDASGKEGECFSNFNGGLIVAASYYQPATDRLRVPCLQLNVEGEVKWSKVAEGYLGNHQHLVDCLFDEIAAGIIMRT